MPENKGYIKLHRSILDWEWYGDIKTRALFMHLLICANWEDTGYMGRVIKRGQLCSTVKELAERNGLTTKEIRTALAHLQATGEITIHTTPHFSIFTIANYDTYQGESTGANKGQTEFAEKGKQNGKPKGKPYQPETANETALENGSIIGYFGNEDLPSGKQEIPERANERANQTANKGQTEFAEKGKPSLLYKEKRNIRSEEYARTRASGAAQNIFETAIEEYNDICKSLPPFKGELNYHQAHLVQEAFKALHGGTFGEYFKLVESSDYLTGRTSRKFKADFLWLIRPENVEKVLSGKYAVTYGSAVQQTGKKDYSGSLWDDEEG